MFPQFQEALNVYLFPFLIAVPIALVLILLVIRRDDTPPESPSEPERQPAAAAAPMTADGRAPTARSVLAPGSAEALPDAPLSVAPDAGTRQLALLLVDDSAVARAKLRKLFEAAGYEVQLARDGVEALEQLGRQRFGLMITDLEMPNMDGIQLIAAVSGSLETENMPILAITGHDDLQAKVHECQGLYGIFKKPWNDRELLRRVETLMRVQQAQLAPH